MATDDDDVVDKLRLFTRRVQVFCVAMALAVVGGLALGVVERNSRIHENSHAIAHIARVQGQIQVLAGIAKRRADRADKNAAQATRVSNRVLGLEQIRHEGICSRRNQGAPCRELFERMIKALTPAQRHRLACDALSALKRVEDVRRASRCP